MTTPAPPAPALALSPFGWVGRTVLHAVAYLGGVASVPGAAVRALSSRRADAVATSDDDTVTAQLAWMFAMGLPLVALLHVGMGSFLAMQSYFGGTFADGTGAVVGVGLLRNLASLLSGLTLAGLLAARIVPELRGRIATPPRAPAAAPAEAHGPGLNPAARLPARALAARLGAAVVAGPVLGFWAAAVGTAVGWQVAKALMGVSTHSFFQMFWEMLWLRDLTGVVVKGMLNGAFAGLFACHEGLRSTGGDDLGARSAAACRAACLAAVAILIVNSGWFILVYHAGPAFGPTLLAPPGL